MKNCGVQQRWLNIAAVALLFAWGQNIRRRTMLAGGSEGSKGAGLKPQGSTAAVPAGHQSDKAAQPESTSPAAAAAPQQTAENPQDSAAAAQGAGPQAQQAETSAARAAAASNLAPEQSWSGKGRRSKHRRTDDNTQTEYVVIPPKAKKRSRDLLTDHQREVLQRQRQGKKLFLRPHT